MCLILGHAWAECRVCNGDAVPDIQQSGWMPLPQSKQPIWTAIGEGNLLLGVTGVLPCPVKSPMSDFFVEYLQL